MNREFHPVADIFPMLEGAAFADLVNDIRQHGQREPITLHPDGRIVDGRNRYRACIEVGESPAYRTWQQERDGDLVPYVVSLNLRRRHLDEAQRAMVGARLATLDVGRPEENTAIAAITQPNASAMLNVSVDSIQRARKVLREGTPELIAAVDKGEVSVRAAAVMASAPATEQREFVAAPAEERRDTVNAIVAERKAPKVDKSRAAVQDRRERLRAMAGEGYSTPQIADALGIDERTVWAIAKAEGVEIVASKIVGHQRRHDSARIMEHIVLDAEGLTTDVHLIALAELDRDQLGDWIDSLERSRRKLSEFISTLKKEHQKHGEAA